ncbi:uncharacterized protein G2W53_012208 [Senna tora]|uniref:Uncharacterized protein n=1 Tax=Senna tora TaxID=362788 RepID=A0A834TWI5_9FABA|nr:uncharacterized protein G2W53_012208 [Senna tora]
MSPNPTSFHCPLNNNNPGIIQPRRIACGFNYAAPPRPESFGDQIASGDMIVD